MSRHVAWDDRERYFAVVASTEDHGDQGFTATLLPAREFEPGERSGSSCWVVTTMPPPSDGEVVICWGQEGLGGWFRGMARLDGTILSYTSMEDLRAEHQRYVAEADKRRQQRWVEQRDQIEQQITALPAILQRRVAILRANNESRKNEAGWLEYEVFVMSQGAALADGLGTVEQIEAFKELSVTEQYERVPTLSDEHSGYTFDAAIATARALLTDPDALIPQAQKGAGQ